LTTNSLKCILENRNLNQGNEMPSAVLTTQDILTAIEQLVPGDTFALGPNELEFILDNTENKPHPNIVHVNRRGANIFFSWDSGQNEKQLPSGVDFSSLLPHPRGAIMVMPDGYGLLLVGN